MYDAPRLAQGWSQLQHLTQLTHLTFKAYGVKEGNPPAAAFLALTASSKLQYLKSA